MANSRGHNRFTMSTAPLKLPSKELRETIDQCMQMHRHGLLRKLRELEASYAKESLSDSDLLAFIERIERSVKQVVARRQNTPKVTYSDQLPISERREEIAKTIEQNQVVVLAGETGSGKTTQIPKICLELGRGVYGQIGHTQPRRIAARTVASRIAEELNVPLGDAVGYQVRFNDQVNDNTQIKLMTDGILLADIQSDPYLNKYDTIIIDEAHERSLNIDFLLGYLKQLLSKRPDLKLIVTSATIDLEKFSKFFNNAPIIEVSGRTYPVDVHYRPWQDEFEDINDAIVNAVEEVLTLPGGNRGDILIFLSGEREIREASHAIKKANLAHVDVLPLYARLSLAEQNKIFSPGGRRKIVLSTNVAETSVTVPGIRYVIDPGTARISRYSLRTKVQRLPIEAVSQASANQRKGRCGRVSDGVCIRLYSEEDFLSRPEFTDAEILRTNLAAVILQMLQMRIGDVRQFPFVDAPDNRLISDGFKLLEELNAVDSRGRVTKLGKQLQQIPLDPKLARIVIEADKWGCLAEILVIVCALSIQDPRERPAEKQQAADEKHRRFWDEQSDFIALVNLWNYVEAQRQELSQNQLRKLCGREFLNFLRLKEWRELHHQVKLAVKNVGLKNTSLQISDSSPESGVVDSQKSGPQKSANKNPALKRSGAKSNNSKNNAKKGQTPQTDNRVGGYEPIHRALVAGLITNIGNKNEEKGARDYFGTRNKKFMIFPGSSQNKKKPKWCIAADYIETSQLFAHQVAKIEPKWVLDAAEHLVKRHYYQPHYDVRSGQVKAYVRITLFGLTLVEKQSVNYSKIDEKVANDIFIRSALVEGGYRGKGTFYQHNKGLIDELHDLEAKSRRRDIMVDDQVIFDFYKERVPEHIVNLAGFEHWRKGEEHNHPECLFLVKESLMLHSAENISVAQFPDTLSFDDIDLPVNYCFEPGKPNDGVSVQTPIELLHQVSEHLLDWLVPGLLRDKCIALVKGLPKQIRKNIVPVPQYVDKVLPRLQRANVPLTEALGAALGHISQVSIKAEDWNMSNLDDFYRMNIQIVDDAGRVIEQDRDLQKLKSHYKQQVQKTLKKAGNTFEKKNIVSWNFGQLPDSVQLDRGAVKVRAYPALEEHGSYVDLKVLDNPQEAKAVSYSGMCRLALLENGQAYKYLIKQLLKGNDLGLSVVNMGKREQVADDIAMAVAADLFFPDFQLVYDEADFKQTVEQNKSELIQKAQDYEKTLIQVMKEVVAIKKGIKSSKNALAIALVAKDVNSQLSQLFYPGCVFKTPIKWFNQLPRYLRAIQIRLEKAPLNPQKDKLAMIELDKFWSMHEERLQKEGEFSYQSNAEWQLFRWMLEEYRVSLFAQTLKTQMPVSDKRLKKQWEKSVV